MAKKRIAGITIELDADTSKLVKGLDSVSRTVGNIGKKIENVGKGLTTHLTVPIVAAAGTAVSKFAEVDKTMVLTNQTMGNTTEQAELLNKAMEEAAANSTFGMNEAATATLNFARAGLTAEEAASALAPALNLAAGEGGDLDTVSAGLVATINGFGDSFDQAEHYADVFANACNNSALDVNSLSDAMSIAAPIFKTAGYSVEDAALYMGVMANAGIDANTAANALKTGMARLVKPAKEGAVWMEKLGIEVTNADGSMKDSITIQSELHDAFAGLSESEQIAAASAIFGKNQMSNWLALINTAPGEVDALAESLGVEGTTAEMADAMMGGFGGSIEKLKSSIDVLMTSLGGLIAQYLTPVIEKVQGAVDAFMALDDETKEHIIKIAGIVAAVGPVLIIIGKVATGISSIVSIASTLITIGSALVGAISAISAPVLIVVAAIAAAIAIGVALYKNWDEICAWAKRLMETIKEAWGKITEAVSHAWDDLKKNTSDAMNNIKDKIANSQIAQTAGRVWDAMKTTVSNSMNAIRQKYDEHGGGLKGAVAASMEAIKQYYTAGFNFIDNLTGGKLSAIKEKVSSAFSGILDTVRSVIDRIKSIFSGSIDFPHFNLPHFHIDGGEVPFGIGGKGYPPSIEVEWYKKAMNSPYFLNGATIFGENNGKLLGGGESGSEMIVGTNKLMDMIAQAKGGDTIITNSFTINGANKDAQTLAQEISFYLDMELQRAESVYR